ncbi:MAG: AbrB/MazE/SpoVT family DNA-binding domain-containing protein [Pyrinomonadaceae bacterium]|nr:AbrB/MazE/SpoVT family DNA-binding domain-containing protein [Pyrinomonadaceae bacterium]
MKAQIIKIGNSKGIRIPKPVLEESQLEGEVELEVIDEGLLVKSTKPPRHGWDEAFRTLAENDDDDLLMGDAVSQFDEENWRW